MDGWIDGCMEWKEGKKEGRKDDGWVLGTPILLRHQLITVNLAGQQSSQDSMVGYPPSHPACISSSQVPFVNKCIHSGEVASRG